MLERKRVEKKFDMSKINRVVITHECTSRYATQTTCEPEDVVRLLNSFAKQGIAIKSIDYFYYAEEDVWVADKFEVGCVYTPYSSEFEPIRVVSRTEKTITVMGVEGGIQWKMRVKEDEDGNEYAVDSKVPSKWRDAFTYRAEWKIEW